MEQKEIVRVIEEGSVPWVEAPGIPGMAIQMLVVQEPEIYKLTLWRLDPASSFSAVFSFTEYDYVIKGEITLSWDDKKVVAKAGDTVCIEPRGEHCLVRSENTGKEPVELFSAVEPFGVQGERGFLTPARLKEIAASM